MFVFCRTWCDHVRPCEVIFTAVAEAGLPFRKLTIVGVESIGASESVIKYSGLLVRNRGVLENW